VLGRRTRAVRTHLRLVPRGDGVIPVSNNRIERYHSEIAPKIRSTQGVKNLELRDYFQFYNLQFLQEDQVETNFRPTRQLGLKPSVKWLMKTNS